ncbi:MAG: hypothetical protein ABJI60_04070 [Kangiellaceae bacterium]|jgi:hypothetical protein
MKFDDLKTGWKTEVEKTGKQQDLTRLVESLEKETKKLDKSIKRRDIMEISIALLLIPVWAWKLFYSASLLQTIGLWIAIVACIYIPYKLLKARQVESAKDDSLLAFLSVEKSKLEKQKELLETIAIWYLSPLMVAIVLITAGSKVDDAGVPQISEQLMVYYLFCGVLYVGVYFLNKRAAKKKFAPLLDRVNQQIQELKSLNNV